VVDTRFVNEVIRVCEPVHGSNLTGIEEEFKHIVVQLTSLRAFRSSLKHLVRALSEGVVDTVVVPVGLLGGGDG